MELEFDCGVVVQSVGNLVMALNHHLTICTNEDCKRDVENNLKRYS